MFGYFWKASLGYASCACVHYSLHATITTALPIHHPPSAHSIADAVAVASPPTTTSMTVIMAPNNCPFVISDEDIIHPTTQVQRPTTSTSTSVLNYNIFGPI